MNAEKLPCYDRDKLRYPSDLTDEEWSLIEPLIPPAKHGGRKREVVVREVMNGVMYVLSTGDAATDVDYTADKVVVAETGEPGHRR